MKKNTQMRFILLRNRANVVMYLSSPNETPRESKTMTPTYKSTEETNELYTLAGQLGFVVTTNGPRALEQAIQDKCRALGNDMAPRVYMDVFSFGYDGGANFARNNRRNGSTLRKAAARIRQAIA